MKFQIEQRTSPISLPSVTDVVYRTLRDEISRGLFPTGPLHLGRLANRFSISTVPVREALRRLEAEGLVSFGSNRRIVVNGLSEAELDEIFVIRSQLEQLAIRGAAHRLCGRPDLLNEQTAHLALMDVQGMDPEAWRTTNQEFHWSLYRAAEMPRLMKIINSLWVAHEPYLRLYVKAVESLHTAQEQHRVMLAQIVAGDADGVAATLADHLETTRCVVRARIREEKAAAADTATTALNGNGQQTARELKDVSA